MTETRKREIIEILALRARTLRSNTTYERSLTAILRTAIHRCIPIHNSIETIITSTSVAVFLRVLAKTQSARLIGSSSVTSGTLTIIVQGIWKRCTSALNIAEERPCQRACHIRNDGLVIIRALAWEDFQQRGVITNLTLLTLSTSSRSTCIRTRLIKLSQDPRTFVVLLVAMQITIKYL